MYPLRGNQDPVPRLHYCFLTVPPLSLHPLPSLMSNCLNVPLGLREAWELNEPISYNQETGDTERLSCPGAPAGAARFQRHRRAGCIVVLAWKIQILHIYLRKAGKLAASALTLV